MVVRTDSPAARRQAPAKTAAAVVVPKLPATTPDSLSLRAKVSKEFSNKITAAKENESYTSFTHVIWLQYFTVILLCHFTMSSHTIIFS
jgi:hypothetical protein